MVCVCNRQVKLYQALLLLPLTTEMKPNSFESRRNSLSLCKVFEFSLSLSRGAGAPYVYVRAWTLCLISTQSFRRALTTSVDNSCAEIKSAPSVAEPILAELGGRCRKAMLGVWEQ